MRALALAALVLLAGCATSPSCSAGVMLLGPIPFPYVDCGVTAEPKDDEEEGDEEEEDEE